jgi:DHA1 family bicyclomycin/chloramphenicol resistance-like MFS transporter
MAPFTKEAGSASALMGSIQMALGAGSSALVGLLSNGTAMPMTGVMVGCSLTAVLILMIGRRAILYRSKMRDVEEQSYELIERY